MSKRDELYQLTERIPDPVVRAFTIYVLDNAPSHFWMKPSSAGKYHPSDEHGFEGLLLHTLRVAGIGIVICESSKPRLNPNTILPASMLHDICRYGDIGLESQFTVPEHPELAANLIRRLGGESNGYVVDIANAVETHTGRWGKIAPRNETEWAVHYADCIDANYHSWS